jgi:hypothetical protein
MELLNFFIKLSGGSFDETTLCGSTESKNGEKTLIDNGFVPG